MNRTYNLTSALTGAAAIVALSAGAASAQDRSDWVDYAPETFAADEFEIDYFAGTVEVIVEDRQGIEISATGSPEHMERFEVDQSGDTVEISFEREQFRWNDWSTWVSWWRETDFETEEYPVVTVRLPEGTPVDVGNMTGVFNMGDLNGPLDFDGAGAVDATIGRLTRADIEIAGAADVRLGDVVGNVSIEVSGAGDVRGGSARNADIALRGAADVSFTQVASLDISIAGIGDVRVDEVNGDVDISIAGSGDVRIEGGRADGFDASIAGAGDIHFGGVAIDPDISIAGAGDVYIQDYEGRLSQSGMGDVTIGSGS